MGWVKLDDKASHHPKLVEAGERGGSAVRDLWYSGLGYCASYGSDFIADGALTLLSPVLKSRPQVVKLAEILVTAGLWARVRGGFRVHHYHEYNPTKQEMDVAAARRRERNHRYQERQKQAQTNQTSESKTLLKTVLHAASLDRLKTVVPDAAPLPSPSTVLNTKIEAPPPPMYLIRRRRRREDPNASTPDERPPIRTRQKRRGLCRHTVARAVQLA